MSDSLIAFQPAIVEKVLVDRSNVMGEMLPFAARVGKPEVDVFNVVLLDHLNDFLGIRHHSFPFPYSEPLLGSRSTL